MYTAPQKRFRFKSQAEIEADLAAVAAAGIPVRRIFLADGDAMTLSVRRLRDILIGIRAHLPEVQRISSYCLPRNLKSKTVAELAELRELGLSLFYVGCESGDNDVLARVRKGETFASSLAALEKIRAAGSKSSVMILNGMGGQHLSEQHARNSARLMNAAQPDYLATLVLSFPHGEKRYRDAFADGFAGGFVPLSQAGLFQEMHMLLSELDLRQTIFRSDHASNYLVLKGLLGRDNERLLRSVENALANPAGSLLRQEW